MGLFCGLYWGLTLSKPAFILEMSLSKPDETRLSRMAVTAFPSAKTEGQSVFKSPGCKHPRLSIPNARLKHSRWHILKLMIKEDHLLACTTRMIEIQIAPPSLRISRERDTRESNDLDRSDNHCCTQQFLSTHPRGLSDYSLVKERKKQELVTAIVVNNFRHSQRSFFRVPQTGCPFGGGE